MSTRPWRMLEPMKEAAPLRSWGIYRAKGLLGVISAISAEALRKARLLNPEVPPAELTAQSWEGARA